MGTNFKAQELADRLLEYPETEWNALINEWCGKDKDLMQKVSVLTNKNRNARDFVEGLQNRIQSLTKKSLTDGMSLPKEISGYPIKKRLGSGGSASVYLVEMGNGQPAALKLLHGTLANSTSKQRFESEQQILTALEHPNISELVEGGITEKGEPYVIMEYVDGIPIDQWCNRNKLGLNDRIRLFQAVCRTVHFAHQNLVVHRDIKPDHVLVTKSGEVKLIDFGIAKLLEPSRLGFAELQTRTGMRIMTPEFASPEQVRGEPVTTVSDLYSLGVLLYLMITGHRPYHFTTTSMLEIERIVCETEPPRPSEVVASSSEQKPADSKLKSNSIKKSEFDTYAGPDLPRLQKLLSGDLDRIVLKAMRKETSGRYASALALADDLDRFIKGEPVAARAPTPGYRARKFVKRNKWTVLAAFIAFLALTGGFIGIAWQSQQARQNAERAEVQAQIAGQVTDFLIDLFESGDPSVAQGSEISVYDLLERGVAQALESEHDPSVQLQLLSVMGRVYGGLGIYSKSAELFEIALNKADLNSPADPLLIADLQSNLGLNLRIMGNLAAADSLYHLALENRRETLGESHPLTIQSLDEWAGIHAYLSRDADLADSLFQDVVDRRRASLETDSKDLAESLNNLAYIKMTKGDYHLALRYYEESSEIYRTTLGEQHPDRLRSLSGLAVAYYRTGNYGRSEQLYHNLIEMRTKVLGDNHPQVAISHYHLANLLIDTGRIEQAFKNIEKSIQIMEYLESPHQFYPDILLSRARLYEMTGKSREAVQAYHQTVEGCNKIRGENTAGCTGIYQAAGEAFLKLQMIPEAKNLLQRAHDLLINRSGPESEEVHRVESLLQKASVN